MKHRYKFLVLFIGTVLAVVLMFSTSELTSRQDSHQDEQENNISLEDVQRFSNAINQIKQYYVESVEDEVLFDNAIKGMLEGLDPHSDYLDKDDFTNLKVSTDGKFAGLGLEITLENDVIKVVTPLDNSPAAKAGIKSGDYIIRLGKTPVKGLSLREAVTLMRGEKGTTIKVTILRKNTNEPIQLTIKRDIIKVQSVSNWLLEDKYGYIRISYFQEKTPADVINAIQDLEKKAGGALQGLILDLRNNPGGLLDSAIEVSDLFIHNDQRGAEELIVSTQGRVPGTNFVAIAQPGDKLKNTPIIIMINEGSASGAEIVAGALQDNQRALIVGTKSFGKGSVQTLLPLDENHAIKLTTAIYYTPKGQSIQAKGIVPDVTIEAIKVKEQENPLSQFVAESDLMGHLQDSVQSLSTKQPDGNHPETTQHLLYTDYQLYEALNILKALYLTQEPKH